MGENVSMKFLEKTNKNILLIGLALLSYRVGNFAYSFLPKPYELLFVVLSLLTIVYVLFVTNIKTSITVIPKNILVAVCLLVGSVLLGWGISVYINHIPTNLNMLLEFGTCIIGLITFLFVLFYGYNDSGISKKYYYALLVPVIFIIFVLFPHSTPSFLLASDGNFVGLTTNVNLISKMLLIPAMYFIVHAIILTKNVKMRIVYICIASLLVSLLLWISSRGAILSLFSGMFFAFLVVASHNFTWKKTFLYIGTLMVILTVGFIFTPYSRKQVMLNRVLNSDTHQFSQEQVRSMGLLSIIFHSFHNTAVQPNTKGIVLNSDEKETRLQIWPFYIKNIIIKNPLGIGPNTHIESNVIDIDGNHVSTGPHNTFLELLLWGGGISLLSFVYLLFNAFLNLGNKLKSNFNPMLVSLLVTLFSLTIAIMFDDSLSLYCFWAVLALSLLPWKNIE